MDEMALPFQAPITMMMGYTAMAGLVLWLLTRRRHSRSLTAVYLSGLLVSSATVVGIWLVVTGTDMLYPVFNPLLFVVTVYVGFVVWAAYQTHPVWSESRVASLRELLQLAMPVLASLGVFVLCHSSSVYIVLGTVTAFSLLLVSVVVECSRRVAPMPKQGLGRSTLRLTQLTLFLTMMPLVAWTSIHGTLPVIAMSLVLLILLALYYVLRPVHSLAPPLERAAYAMTETAVLLVLWQVGVHATAAQRWIPIYPDINILSLFSIMAVMTARLILAVRQEKTGNAECAQVQGTEPSQT
ncbi:MAG: hypothetical protein HXY34_04045 [Candidatus Thorarchaeota archaeon]|nr:hypothetical protein [Candidatus Thorarchaeota archaeon]